SRIGIAVHVWGVFRFARDREDLQHLFFYGFDHGDRHRREKRNSTSRRRPAFPRRRILRSRRHDSRRRTPAASNLDDRASYYRRNDSSVSRDRRRVADVAAVGDRGDRRTGGFYGFIPD